eukprot:6179042-Pleurochrysis_carterae.AAC.7
MLHQKNPDYAMQLILVVPTKITVVQHNGALHPPVALGQCRAFAKLRPSCCIGTLLIKYGGYICAFDSY